MVGLVSARRIAPQDWEFRYVRQLLAADLVVGLAAAGVAFGIRFGPDITHYNARYLLFSLLLPVAWVTVLACNQGYERRHLFVGTAEYERVFRSGLALAAAVTVVAYTTATRLSRGYVIIVLPLVLAGTVLVRHAMRKRLHRARSRGRHLRRALVLGHPAAVRELCARLRRERYHGLAVVGACLPPGAGPPDEADLAVYGTFDRAAAAVVEAGADTVVVLACPELSGTALRRLAWQLETDRIDLIVASALVDVAGGRTTIRPVDGLPMLHVDHARLRGARRVCKSVFDRCGAALLLVAFAPVLLAVAVVVRLGSAGPVLFRQVRVGRDGREFVLYKFRTMRPDAEDLLPALAERNEHDGVLFKIRDDPRVTRPGRWLRRYSLDELPQLVNVLAGQMSLVGPRPPLPAEVADYPTDMRRRLVVKPGLTGLWQVSGRAALSWEEAVRLDLRYVENWSLALDLVILLRTLTAVLRSAGAY